jgi:hypothetical protein
VDKVVQVVPEVCRAHLDRPPATRRAPTRASGSAATSATAQVNQTGLGPCGSHMIQYQPPANPKTRHQAEAIEYHS